MFPFDELYRRIMSEGSLIDKRQNGFAQVNIKRKQISTTDKIILHVILSTQKRVAIRISFLIWKFTTIHALNHRGDRFLQNPGSQL